MKPATLRRTVDATVEPVTLEEAKAQLHILGDQTVEDDYITALITAARNWCEEWTKRAFITQTWVAEYECWPTDGIFLLARPNVQSVEGVAYVDFDGDVTPIDDEEYFTALSAFPGEVRFPCGYSVPTFQTDYPYPISIEFVTGFGDAASDVPMQIRQAILMMVHHFYVNRVPVNIGNIVTKIPLSVESLLQFYRVRNT